MASDEVVTNDHAEASGTSGDDGYSVGVSVLRLMHDTQVSLEKMRIQVGNRVAALNVGADQVADETTMAYMRLHEILKIQEADFELVMAKHAAAHPVWPWLGSVRGIGPALGSQMLSMLLPPLEDRGPSTWYKAAGLTVELRPDGTYRLPRARAGEGKITYYPRLRRCLHNVAESFVRQGGYYREIYDVRKTALIAKHVADETWPPHRLDSVARWATVKLFLAHLYEEWSEAIGIHGRRAYVVDRLGHHYVPPPQADGGKKI